MFAEVGSYADSYKRFRFGCSSNRGLISSENITKLSIIKYRLTQMCKKSNQIKNCKYTVNFIGFPKSLEMDDSQINLCRI